MITVIPVGGWGITSGVNTLKRKIQENKQSFIDVMCIEKEDEQFTTDCAFVTLFETGLGQYAAFINEWGTNYGEHAGGAGSSGYEEFTRFLTESEVIVDVLGWDSIPEDLLHILEESTSTHKRMIAWEKVIFDHMFPLE